MKWACAVAAAVVACIVVGVYWDRACDNKMEGQKPPETTADESWSIAVNGMRARIDCKESEVVNQTPIISTYLTLGNVSDMGSPMKVAWDGAKMSIRVMDEKGKELPPAFGAYDGMYCQLGDLVIPHDGELTFNIAGRGFGISRGKAASVDLGGLQASWEIDKADGRKWFLQVRLTIPDSGRAYNEGYWHGTIEIPKAQIPVRNTTLDK